MMSFITQQYSRGAALLGNEGAISCTADVLCSAWLQSAHPAEVQSDMAATETLPFTTVLGTVHYLDSQCVERADAVKAPAAH